MSLSENRRQRSRRVAERWKTRALVAWIVVFTFTTMYSLREISTTRVVTREQIAESIFQNCESTSRLLITLIKPGIQNTAKIEYYKTHPDELVNALARIHESLRLASPHRCLSLPSNKYRRHK